MQYDPRWKEDDFIAYRMRYLDRQRFLVSNMWKMMILTMVMMVLVFLVIPVKRILERYEAILSFQAAGMEKMPNLQKQIDLLQKQLVALTNESIESRLRTIETAIHAGDIKLDEIASLQDLRKDLTILKTYMFRDPAELVELKQLQKNYQEIKDNQNRYMLKEDVMREIHFMSNLFYTSIALFSLLLATMGGSWWFSNKKLKKMSIEMSKRYEESSSGKEEK